MASSEPHFAELVFGLVAPVGTNLDRVENQLERGLGAYGYRINKVRLSALAQNFCPEGKPLSIPTREAERLSVLMSHGNSLREAAGRGDFLALAAAKEINAGRSEDGGAPRLKTAHVLRSLKHPDEVLTLRRIYGPGFFLVAIVVGEKERRDALEHDKNCTPTEIDELLKRDEHEAEHELGQRTRETFQLADAFLRFNDESQLARFLRLVFGAPFDTPTAEEQAMFTAFSASLRSADLSRQVGAAIVSARGDIVAVGANDVPQPGGGQYWPGDTDVRDHVNGVDSNERQREKIFVDVVKRLLGAGAAPDRSDEEWLEMARPLLGASLLMDITEYGRAVHAEMEAILSCTRSGVPTVGGTLFSTTFPCHNCAKHIVAAALQRVVYVEPYPKSQALELFPDSIRQPSDVDDGTRGRRERVLFEPFVGIGPRRYYDLFSMSLSSGYKVKRKAPGGTKLTWDTKSAYPRVPLLATSYIEREKLAAESILEQTTSPTEPKP